MRFDPDKALVVMQKHGIDMESVKQEILAGRFATRMVKNQVEDGTFFLKTAFKSRFYQRRYENGELKIYR